MFDRDWFMIAENDGETVAVAITIPDINQVLKRMGGRLLPFGWWHYLSRGRIIDRVRIGFLGVLPEYQHTGVAAALYMRALRHRRARAAEARRGELRILETNKAMNRGLEAMGGGSSSAGACTSGCSAEAAARGSSATAGPRSQCCRKATNPTQVIPNLVANATYSGFLV